MARSTTKKSSGNSKIRFIMLEADLGEGDLTEAMRTITNALQQGGAPRRVIAAPVSSDGDGQEPERNGDGEETEFEVFEEDVTAERPVRRTYRTPQVLADLDLTSGEMPFADLAAQKGPRSANQRYLLVAYWCKKYRNVEVITADHVYTCFKFVKWGTGRKNFAQPLRDLARQGRGATRDGNFTINHIGENIIDELGGE